MDRQNVYSVFIFILNRDFIWHLSTGIKMRALGEHIQFKQLHLLSWHLPLLLQTLGVEVACGGEKYLRDYLYLDCA